MTQKHGPPVRVYPIHAQQRFHAFGPAVDVGFILSLHLVGSTLRMVPDSDNQQILWGQGWSVIFNGTPSIVACQVSKADDTFLLCLTVVAMLLVLFMAWVQVPLGPLR